MHPAAMGDRDGQHGDRAIGLRAFDRHREGLVGRALAGQ